jgi:hypothetical protein
MIRAVETGTRTGSATAAAARPAPAGKVRDIFLARLGDLEERVEKELGRAPATSGPAGEFVFDFVREAWRAGAGVASAATSAAGRRGLLAWLSAAPEVDDLGLDELAASGGILAIEWPDRLTRPWPDALHVTLTHAGETTRRITISGGRNR